MLRFYDTNTITKVEVEDSSDGVEKAYAAGLVPSVTTVLGVFHPEYIINWNIRNSIKHYMKCGDVETAVNYRDRTSSDFGSVCHNLLEYYLSDEGIPEGISYDDAYQLHLKTVVPLFKWVDLHVEEVIFTEESFADKELGYAGTADMLILMKDGTQMLLDLKCKKHRKEYPMTPSLSYLYQLSAYRNHFKKKYGDMEIGNVLIAAPVGNGTKTPRLRYYPYIGKDWSEGFNTSYKLWKMEYLDEIPDYSLELM